MMEGPPDGQPGDTIPRVVLKFWTPIDEAASQTCAPMPARPPLSAFFDAFAMISDIDGGAL